MKVKKYDLEINENKIPYLVTEKDNLSKMYPCTSPDKVADMLESCFRLKHQAEEHVVMISVNVKCEPIGVFEVSHGGLDHSIVSTKNILTRALLSGAHGIFIAHNHPSGDTTPSIQDKMCCKKIIEAAKLLEIEVLDFIIVGNDYKSFNKEGLL